MARKTQPARRAPRYRQLAEQLIAEIRGGGMPLGATIPGELELAQRFRVSRHTVREALSLVERLGLIARRQGIGTVVRSRHPRKSYIHTARSAAELMRYPPDSRLRVVCSAKVRTDRRLARRLGCAPGTDWFRISAVRRVGNGRPPLCWTDIYVLPRFARIVDVVGRRSQLVAESIESRYGVKLASVQVSIVAGTISEHAAVELDVAGGSPALIVVRRYVGEDRRVFEISFSEHPADRYAYTVELQRGWRSGSEA